jgi:hypothetical protein
MKKPLQERKIVGTGGWSRNFIDLTSSDRTYRKVAESWEEGRSFVAKGSPDISRVSIILAVLADFVSGKETASGDVILGTATKTWCFHSSEDYTLYSLADGGYLVVKATGDYDNVVEGGYTQRYRVLMMNVPVEKRKLVYNSRSFSCPGFPNQLPGPHGSITRDLNDMREVFDEELSELRRRGIEIVAIPEDR